MAEQDSAQQEPTMEEILASIRRIISEDGDEAQEQPQEVQAEEEPVDLNGSAEDEPPVALVEEEPVADVAEENDDVLELTEALEEIEPEPEPEPVVQAVPDPEPEPEPEPIIQSNAEPAVPEATSEDNDLILVEDDEDENEAPVDDSALLSDATTGALAASFGQLSNQLVVASTPGQTLEGMLGALLKPMLKEWLDENLPPMVERIVQEEIARVSRTSARQ